MARNPLHTARAVTLISLAKEIERFCGVLEQFDLRLSFISAEEMRSRAHAIAHEADTMALPKRLIPSARAVGDSAYLLEQLVLQGRAAKDDDSVIVMSSETFQEACDYTQKALEALKFPARYYGADVDALEMSGGLYL
ncbi:MAG: hypothetical protein FWF45_00540 [Coriobacteriia bacterium]|nr:hypothetical protein [Coriobacteriia bacterium]